MQCKTLIILSHYHEEKNQNTKHQMAKVKSVSSRAFKRFPTPWYANISFLKKKKNHLCSDISSQLFFTLTNIFSGRQEIHFSSIWFDKWNGNCSQLLSFFTEKRPGARRSPPCFGVLTVTSLTRSSFSSWHELWDIFYFSLTVSWVISFITKIWF